MNLKEYIQSSFKESANNLVKLSESGEVQAQLMTAAEWIIESIKKGGKLLTAGNGGSAADAQHIAAELVAKLSRDRTSIAAIALTVDTSLLTAVGNDYGYDFIYDRQLQGLAQPPDIFLAITTSGNSKNILKALERAKLKNVKSILLTGFDGGKARALADLTILAPGNQTAQIQEAHIAIYHTLCFLIEKSLVESGHVKYLD
ncbi:MAG: SIS domain-containing protein [Bdellovibrionota bacterium]